MTPTLILVPECEAVVSVDHPDRVTIKVDGFVVAILEHTGIASVQGDPAGDMTAEIGRIEHRKTS